MKTLMLRAGACVVLASLFACAPAETAKIPDWSNAQELAVRAKDEWKLEQNGVTVTCTTKRGPKHMQLDLAIAASGPKLKYDEVRAFWDNEELEHRGVAIGEISAKQGEGDAWTSKCSMQAKVHKWPDKDIVYLAVGKAVWKLTVSP